MALIVEDGSGVDGANTYASRDVYLAYALSRGVEIDDDDPADVQLISAMDYLAGQCWKGQPVDPFQPLGWPRKYVYIGSNLWDQTAIPADIVNAQCALAMQVAAGIDINPTVGGALVTEETVGPITTKYSDKYGQAIGAPNMPLVETLLRRWIDYAFGFRVVRA